MKDLVGFLRRKHGGKLAAAWAPGCKAVGHVGGLLTKFLARPGVAETGGGREREYGGAMWKRRGAQERRRRAGAHLPEAPMQTQLLRETRAVGGVLCVLKIESRQKEQGTGLSRLENHDSLETPRRVSVSVNKNRSRSLMARLSGRIIVSDKEVGQGDPCSLGTLTTDPLASQGFLLWKRVSGISWLSSG